MQLTMFAFLSDYITFPLRCLSLRQRLPLCAAAACTIFARPCNCAQCAPDGFRSSEPPLAQCNRFNVILLHLFLFVWIYFQTNLTFGLFVTNCYLHIRRNLMRWCGLFSCAQSAASPERSAAQDAQRCRFESRHHAPRGNIISANTGVVVTIIRLAASLYGRFP